MTDPRLPEGTTQADIDAYHGEEPAPKPQPRRAPVRREWHEATDGPAADRAADAYFDRLFEPKY